MKLICLLFCCLCAAPVLCQAPISAPLPRLTLDEAFDYVQIQSVAISPDGNAVAIGTRTPDWKESRFLQTLWLYRNGALRRLTEYGSDHDPEWSPDGQWIAFLSNRKTTDGKTEQSGTTQVYLISASGGEAFPATHEESAIDAFAWSPDSKTLYFAAKKPLSDADKKDHSMQWHDVIQFRKDERGDVICRKSISTTIADRDRIRQDVPQSPAQDIVASLSESVSDMAVSPMAPKLPSQPKLPPDEFRKSPMMNLSVTAAGGIPRRLTQNEASERDVQWSHDGRKLIFHVAGARSKANMKTCRAAFIRSTL